MLYHIILYYITSHYSTLYYTPRAASRAPTWAVAPRRVPARASRDVKPGFHIYIYIYIHTHNNHIIMINDNTHNDNDNNNNDDDNDTRPGPPQFPPPPRWGERRKQSQQNEAQSHGCHILPFRPIPWNTYFPPEPANTAKHSPKSISEGGRIWQVWKRSPEFCPSPQCPAAFGHWLRFGVQSGCLRNASHARVTGTQWPGAEVAGKTYRSSHHVWLYWLYFQRLNPIPNRSDFAR